MARLPLLMALMPVLFLVFMGLFSSILHAAEAQLPAGEKVTWGQEPVEVLSAKRAQVCLNGLWRFTPAVGPTATNPQGDWGYIRVPGDWQVSDPLGAGLIAKGSGPAWEGFAGNQLARAWYQRSLAIPANWQGRAILLDLQRVSTDALVVVNGQECGRVEWPFGMVDITKAVTPGQTADLRILVIATADAGYITNFMGYGNDEENQRRATLGSRGIIGDVTLMSRPTGAHVSDIFVQPSTRQQQVTLDVELTGVRQAGTVQLEARMLNEQGTVEKTFRSTAQVAAQGVQRIAVSWPWANPRLWDVGQPNLYTLQLAVTGTGLDDIYAQPFGFREFWVEGRKCFLNGTEFRMRPTLCHDETRIQGTAEAIDYAIDGLMWAGFNAMELWPHDHDLRGTKQYREQWVMRADQKGFPIIGNALNMVKYVNTWEQPGVKATWEQRMAAELRRYRNHPSALLWTTSANRFYVNNDQDPHLIGNREKLFANEPGKQKVFAAAQEAEAIIKKYDPTRPIFTHSGIVGDLQSTNSYLDLIPLQEREEWLSEWAQTGDMPYMVVEFGTPLDCTMMRGRAGGGWGANTGATYSEPLMSEFCSSYFGDAAYQAETQAYRNKVRELFVNGQMYQSWQSNKELAFAPAFQMLQYLFSTNTYRSWRTMGMTAGAIPYDNGHGWDRSPSNVGAVTLEPFTPGRRGTYVRQVSKSLYCYFRPEGMTIYPGGHALMEANGPALAWICGQDVSGDTAAFTAKDHNFTAGQPVAKRIALLNDTRTPQDFSLTWQVTVDGKPVASGREQGRVETGTTTFFPVTFTVPAAMAGQKVDGEVTLTATIGAVTQQDRFAFRVFTPQPKATGTLAVYDPVGETTTLLQTLGYTVQPWRGAMDVPVVVIGRKVLSSGQSLPANLDAYVQGGGRALLMGQDPEWLRQQLGFRVARYVTRRVFPVHADHPVIQGLDAEDLRDWTGSSILVEPYPDITNTRYPTYGWHWGNRGAVTSAAVEKPHRSGWRPILECEFDLAYSPLMELDYGQGRLTLCTLDLEDHVAQDAAAAKLASQLLASVRTAPLQPRAANVRYLGNAAGAAFLDQEGVSYQRGTTLDNTTTLAVIGADAPCTQAELTAYLQNGGKVLILPQAKPDAGLGVTLQQVTASDGSLNVPAWPECRGLSASDLRWRASHDAWLVRAGSEVGADGQLARVQVGNGVAIICQLDPNRFDADQKTFFRYTRWRQTRAIAQILANMGAAFQADRRVFSPSPLPQLALAGSWQAAFISKAEAGTKDPGVSAMAHNVLSGQGQPAWVEVTAPKPFANLTGEWAEAEGEAILRKVVELPADWQEQHLVLTLGPLNMDKVYLNGTPLPLTHYLGTSWAGTPRAYFIPPSLLKPGKNEIMVRYFGSFASNALAGSAEAMRLTPNVNTASGWYHPDYRSDFDYGDDPYRYCRW